MEHSHEAAAAWRRTEKYGRTDVLIFGDIGSSEPISIIHRSDDGDSRRRHAITTINRTIQRLTDNGESGKIMNAITDIEEVALCMYVDDKSNLQATTTRRVSENNNFVYAE